jgi:hypothetical protein
MIATENVIKKLKTLVMGQECRSELRYIEKEQDKKMVDFLREIRELTKRVEVVQGKFGYKEQKEEY